MRVLQVVNGFPPEASGGGDLYASRLARALGRHAEVHVLAATRRPAASEGTRFEEVVDGQRVTRLQRTYQSPVFESPWRSRECEDAFASVLDAVRPEIVHFHHFTGLSLPLPVLARAAGARVVTTLHDYWLPCQRGQLIDRMLRPCPGPSRRRCASCWPGPGAPSWPRRALGFHRRRRDLHANVRATELFLAPAQRIKGWFEAWFASENLAAEITLEPYGMPALETPPHPPAKPRTGALRLGFLGMMMFTKGVHILLEAFLELDRDLARGMEIHCHGGFSAYHEIGGYEAYFESLREKAPESIHFHGPYDPTRLPDILGSLDAVCCPSLWPENSPLVVHEALQAGVPVLGSDGGGIPELVRPGRDGYLLPPGDVPAWRNLLGRISSDPEVLRALPVSAEAVQDLESHVDRMMSLYSSLVVPGAAR